MTPRDTDTELKTPQRPPTAPPERPAARPLDELAAGPAPIDSPRWGWILALGVLTTLGGVAALVLPGLTALTFNIFLGVLLIFEAAFQGVQAFELRRSRGAIWRALGAALALAAGGLLLLFPLTGVLTLAVVLGAYLIADGVARGLFSVNNWSYDAAGWLLFSGLISVALGVLVLLAWPQAAAWILGIFVGVHLLFGGLSLCAMAVNVRRWRQDEARTAWP